MKIQTLVDVSYRVNVLIVREITKVNQSSVQNTLSYWEKNQKKEYMLTK